MKLSYLLFSASLLCACAGAAQAQTVANRTTDVTVTFDNPNNFANASGLYALSIAYPEQTAFTGSTFDFQPLSNATNIAFQSNPGGITVVPPAGSFSPPSVGLTIDGNGAAGSWTGSYNTAATTSGPLLTFTTLNGHHVLDFNGGGSLSSTNGGFDGIQFYVFVHLPGDLSLGTATGDVDYIGANPGFNFAGLTSDGTTTTLEVVDSSYIDGTSAGVHFDLIGAAVPEPATWAMLLLGFFGVGFMVRGARRKDAIAAA